MSSGETGSLLEPVPEKHFNGRRTEFEAEFEWGTGIYLSIHLVLLLWVHLTFPEMQTVKII